MKNRKGRRKQREERGEKKAYRRESGEERRENREEKRQGRERDIWTLLGGIWRQRCQETSRRHEAPTRHPGDPEDTQEAPKRPEEICDKIC